MGTIRKLTKKEVDERIMQIVQQMGGEQTETASSGQPNIKGALMNLAKTKGNTANGVNNI